MPQQHAHPEPLEFLSCPAFLLVFVCWERPCLTALSAISAYLQSLGLSGKVLAYVEISVGKVEASVGKYYPQLRTNSYRSCGWLPSNPLSSVPPAELFT